MRIVRLSRKEIVKLFLIHNRISSNNTQIIFRHDNSGSVGVGVGIKMKSKAHQRNKIKRLVFQFISDQREDIKNPGEMFIIIKNIIPYLKKPHQLLSDIKFLLVSSHFI